MGDKCTYWERRLPAGEPSQASGLVWSHVVAAIACRLEAGAPSRYA